MSKLLVVFGSTGQQGGSVVDYVINDPELSKEYKVRAVTRDLSKPEAQALQKKGVEVVQGDADDKESLKRSLQGAHSVFSVTVTIYDEKRYERELSQGKAIADAAVAAGAQFIVFSTLTHAGKGSQGALKHVEHFDVKAEVEEYIRSLPIKSSFFAPGMFMQNFHHQMGPRAVGPDVYAIAHFLPPDTLMPLIDTASDSGKYVGAMLASPDKYSGKVFSAATGLYSYQEIVDTMSKVTGKKIEYSQVPKEVFQGFLPPNMAPFLVDMFEWIKDYGYYGKGTAEQVEWTSKQARGKLTTFEEYLKKFPLNLE